MTEKNEPQYIGRYGEVLENVHEMEHSLEEKNPKTRTLGAIGLDERGVKRRIMFDISRKTGKKCGRYYIYRPKEEQKGTRFNSCLIEQCFFLNDLLHRDDIFYNERGEKTKKIWFLRGRQLNGNVLLPKGYAFGEEERESREYIAEKSRDFRKLFSDESVVEAIKTGNVLKVKSAITQAIKEKHTRTRG